MPTDATHGLLPRIAALVLVGVLGLAASPGWADAVPSSVTLQLKWRHQFQFAGYYAALEKGYYREAGLNVRIVEAKPETDVVDEVVSGRASFGIGTSALVLSRARGKPVVVLGVVFQHSPLVILVRPDAGIGSVHDLAGKRLMLEHNAEELLAYLHREGVPVDALHTLPHDLTLDDLILGRVDAVSAYATDEPFFLERRNIRYLTFSPRSAGIDFYGDNLFTSEAELRDHPERVRAVREASMRGWRYAMAHPEEIADLILSRYSDRHTREHLLFEADRMRSLVLSDLVEPGYMFLGRWTHIAEIYTELGLLRGNDDLRGFLYDPAAWDEQERRKLFAAIAMALAAGAVLALIAAVLFRLNRRLKIEVAARERAMAAARDSADMLRFIAENTRDVIWVMDIASRRISYVSPSVERMRGYAVDEIISQPIERTLTGESFERVSTMLDETIARWEAGDRSDTMTVTEVDQPHKDGSIIQTEVVSTLHADAEGRLVSVLGVTRNVTERKRADEEIRRLAFVDPLTALPNRRSLLDRLSQHVAWAKREKRKLALLFIDLDRFKGINDSLGHEIGDLLLQSVATRIRESDTAARIGGDEFVVLLPDVRDIVDATSVVEKMRRAIERPFQMPDGRTLTVSASVGVAVYPDHGQDGRDLLRYGDEAMYRAKRSIGLQPSPPAGFQG
ncbi:MAG: ABC transporter substrate-binding protein [Rhodospirillaceae bacterium]